ncbi:HD-GYP domain-containing protein [Geobacillus stearothermophilus]|uniref:HD-GYP domain-containing protein n=1 Tax=Geobacillus stearothermophilus TaxID=1422 RepID=UPI003D1BA0A2
MRKIHISHAKSGDVLAVDLFAANGSVLLSRGVRLTNGYIRSLAQKGVQYIYIIDDKQTYDIRPRPLISPTVRQQAVKKVYETMTALIEQKKLLSRVSSLDLGKEYENVFKDILDYLLKQEDLLINLSDLVISNGYFFHHSVNVATIAGVIGIAKGYRPQQLLDLGIGALLFDIGMTQLPDGLWRKKGELTKEETEIVRRHTYLGFELLRRQRNISLFSAHCALQHHERCDGNGYPLALSGDDIHEYARIVAIADVFDALTSARYHRRQYSPHEAAEYLSRRRRRSRL